ncbi:MAG: HAMP domain-containing histidine kinase [Chitinispirillaceae bacterium]|nr:HAMP domain-containing histidine kinase [Chitinispirillaceae bacterium]
MQRIRTYFIGKLIGKATGPNERGRISLCFWFVLLFLLTMLFSIPPPLFYKKYSVTAFFVILLLINITALFSLRFTRSYTIAVVLQTIVVLAHAIGNSLFAGGNLSIVLFIWPLIYTFFLNFILGNKKTIWYILLFTGSVTGLSLARYFGILSADPLYDQRITAMTGMIMLPASVFLYLFTRVFEKTRDEITAHQIASVESRDNILHLVANDLSNAIAGLMISLDLLSLTIRDKKCDEAEEILKLFEKSVDNSANIINDLLESASLPASSADLMLTTVDLGALVRRLGGQFDTAMEKKNIRFSIRLPAEYVTLTADEEQLYKVFVNLMSNAVKFTPAGGTIAISIADASDYIQVAVRDSGIGMPEEIVGKLFVKSSKTGRKGTDGERSTGLGMYVVKTILDAHKATISVRSEVQRGSEFTVRLSRHLTTA